MNVTYHTDTLIQIRLTVGEAQQLALVLKRHTHHNLAPAPVEALLEELEGRLKTLGIGEPQKP